MTRGQDKWDLPRSWAVTDAEPPGPSSPSPVLRPCQGLGSGVSWESGGPHWEGCRPKGRDRELSLEAIHPQGCLIPSDPSLSFYSFLGRAHGRAATAPGGIPLLATCLLDVLPSPPVVT